VADTEKQGFRYPKERWTEAVTKTAEMREQGYSIDMTRVLAAEVDRFRTETVEQTAERLGLQREPGAVPIYRNPYAREATG
jgi:hypothetical protein